MLGGPIYGRIGDVLGERTALLVALSSTMATYVVTGLFFNMSYVFSAVIRWTDGRTETHHSSSYDNYKTLKWITSKECDQKLKCMITRPNFLKSTSPLRT